MGLMGLTILYHENHPHGLAHEFKDGYNQEGKSLETLVEEGWVDNPGKIGVNLWGTEKAQAGVEQLRNDFKAHRRPAIDSPQYQSDFTQKLQDDLLELQRENERLIRSNRDPKNNIEDRIKDFDEGQEREHDLISDAVKISDKSPDVQVQVAEGPEVVSRRDRIKRVIMDLDRSNPLHFTNGGRAQIPAIELTAGYSDVSAAERDDIQDEIERELEAKGTDLAGK